jgi:hypothetical protein
MNGEILIKFSLVLKIHFICFLVSVDFTAVLETETKTG